MGTDLLNSTGDGYQEEGSRLNPSPLDPTPLHPSHLELQKLDAGALFVLESKGSWIHCWYHLTTAIVGPALLSLPFSFASLGWVAGVTCLTIGAIVTFYSFNLLSVVIEHHEQHGRRQLRFRDMATDILGPKWGRYYVGPLQFGLCYGAVVGSIVLGGQSMKFIYVLSNPNGSIKLYEFVAIFGAVMLLLAQIPSFHSLRHINLVSLVLSLAYSICATAGSIYIGNSTKASSKVYSLASDGENRVFSIFNALSIIAASYGNGILPEIQATLAPPIKGKMFRGLCMCYVVIFSTFFSVAISGYWAFGNLSAGSVLSNFIVDGKPLVPDWFVLMTNIFVLLQVSVVGVVYLQPTNDMLERKFANAECEQFSLRNVVPRLVSRSFAVIIATIISAMLPFFSDINAFLGALGIFPLNFILPMIFYNLTFRPSKWSLLFWGNAAIAVVFSIVGMIGVISAIRQIVLDAKNYHLFANL
ncbi:GABA transporter 1-like isoform X2 [Magnolia sinica]|uniref:GABA transporter 1-like isoform X2 n=1 Tax=Magnolia sinica TaxID=86752 RepID=UPI00265846AF|nr:GABA transporter 1-like isoform X2 [Magnolia sinica]